LRSNLAVNVGYFHTSYGNFQVTDNLATTNADFDSYCITAPKDSRLPGGGGYPMCGLADLNPAKFGQVNNLVRQASDVGKITQTFDGVDISMNSRFGRGIQFGGGISMGQSVYNNCGALMDVSPGTSPLGVGAAWIGNQNFCDQKMPWASQNQLKFQGVYPLPWWGIQASGTFQSLPGIPSTGNYVATNAAIAPSLGRNLSTCPTQTGACSQTVTVNNLFDPNTQLEGRLNQVDMRLAKNFRMRGFRLTANLDLYNIFNASTITVVNTTYSGTGTTWLAPRGILPGRLFKIGAQVTY
jgi:hypothetical protein